ncbi:hypothetical protein Tco_1262797 [Tanacetum coccineum]
MFNRGEDIGESREEYSAESTGHCEEWMEERREVVYTLARKEVHKEDFLEVYAERRQHLDGQTSREWRGGLLGIKELLQNNAAEELSTVS